MSTLIQWVPAFLCVSVAVLVLVGDFRANRRFKKESSRFKMFAVRDKLVQLVATGEMSEDDPIWRSYYLTANDFLHLDTRADVFGILVDAVKYEARNDGARGKFRKKVQEAKARSQGFSAADKALEDALFQLVIERTSKMQWIGLIVLVAVAAAVHLGFKHIGRLVRTTSTIMGSNDGYSIASSVVDRQTCKPAT